MALNGKKCTVSDCSLPFLIVVGRCRLTSHTNLPRLPKRLLNTIEIIFKTQNYIYCNVIANQLFKCDVLSTISNSAMGQIFSGKWLWIPEPVRPTLCKVKWTVYTNLDNCWTEPAPFTLLYCLASGAEIILVKITKIR